LAYQLLRAVYHAVERRGKLILVDADNTLWTGLCSESQKIQFSQANLFLQRFLVEQLNNGYLLGICSKNNESDVQNAILSNKQCLLKKEHIQFWLVNWDNKFSNISRLMIQTGLDASDIILIDDNRYELIEVKQQLSSIMAFQFIDNLTEMQKLLHNIWLFDSRDTGSAMYHRQQSYHNMHIKHGLRAKSLSHDFFLNQVGLIVDVDAYKDSHKERLVEMSCRVTQFNTCTKQLNHQAINDLLSENNLWVVSAKDHYDDHGVIGFVAYAIKDSCILVNMFMLSCRVLLFKIEYIIVRRLQDICRKHNIKHVHFKFKKTKRNTPAHDFLSAVCGQVKSTMHSEVCFDLPALKKVTIPEANDSKDYPIETREVFFTNAQLLSLAALSEEVSTGNLVDSSLDYVVVKDKLKMLWEDVLECSILDNTDFMVSGGTSFKALIICEKLASQFGVMIPVYKFMQNMTFKCFCEVVSVSKKNIIANNDQITEEDNTSACLSESQKSMYYLSKLQPNMGVYNIPISLYICKDVEKSILLNSLVCVIGQWVIPNFPDYQGACHNNFNVDKIKIIDKDINSFKMLSQCLDNLTMQPIDIDNSEYFKLYILRYREGVSILHMVFHHMIFDGHSGSIFLTKLEAIYNNKPVQQVAKTYKDFIQWEHSYLTSNHYYQGIEYWKSTLYGYIKKDIFCGLVKGGESHQGAYSSFAIERQMDCLIRKVAKSCKTTPLAVYFAVLVSVLNQLYSVSDIVIGLPTNTRPDKTYQNVIGNFVNPLPVRIVLDATLSCQELIQSCHRSIYTALEYRHVPFRRIVKSISTSARGDENPIFDVMFSYQDWDNSAPILSDQKAEFVKQGYPAARLKLIIEMHKNQSGMSLGFYYRKSVVSKDDIERIDDCFRCCMDRFVSGCLDESFITGVQASLQANIQRSMSGHADNVAMKSVCDSMTYGDLDKLSNQIARYLQINYSVKKQCVVITVVAKSFYSVALIVAIHKLGAIYAPVVKQDNSDYISDMIINSHPHVVISEEKIRIKNVASVILDEVILSAKMLSADEVITMTNADDVCYIITTSGSTGEPKRISITYKNLLYTLDKGFDIFDFSSNDVVPLLHELSFDVSIWEVWCALLNGASLYIPSNMGASAIVGLPDELLQAGVTVLNQTPSFFKAIFIPKKNILHRLLSRLRLLLFAGEPLHPIIFSNIKLPNSIAIYNLYGATEATIHSTVHKIYHHDITNNVSSIGLPLMGTGIFLLNEHKKEVGHDEVGEIYISGPGVSTVLCEQLKGSFINYKGYLCYKTGDLAKYNETGGLVYVSRNDGQVKINGYRVSLEQIEAAAYRLDGCVYAQSFIDKSLQQLTIALYFSCRSSLVTTQQIQDLLRKYLPFYMVPENVYILDKLPMTHHKKVDKREVDALGMQIVHDANMEIRSFIYSTLQKVLPSSHITDDANFDSIGLDSFILLNVYNTWHKRFPSLQLIDVFNQPNIGEFIKWVEKNKKELMDSCALYMPN
jgi:amino acid adenylation domain-containing protein/FkbH-like protein